MVHTAFGSTLILTALAFGGAGARHHFRSWGTSASSSVIAICVRGFAA
jgi:hypothetical protein